MRLGFVHTVPSLAASFEQEAVAARPGVTALHVVDASLLAHAIARGDDHGVDDVLERHVRHLGAVGASAILVTCSSIGEATERVARGAAVPVVRIDAAMAEDAVETAGTGGILVLATLNATLGPTGRLLAAAAARRDRSPSVSASIVEGAADARAAGDLETHDALVRAAVSAAEAKVVVLAQASMASAAEAAAGGRHVLSSPESGLAALLEVAQARS